MDFIKLIFQCWALQIYPRNILEILKKKKQDTTYHRVPSTFVPTK